LEALLNLLKNHIDVSPRVPIAAHIVLDCLNLIAGDYPIHLSGVVAEDGRGFRIAKAGGQARLSAL
jgi:hypothetical protein